VYIRVAIIYGLVFAPVLLSAERCGECSVCQEEFVEDADYEMFEEFERAFEQFDKEAIVEDEDDSDAHKKGFLKKWKKKLKKWFAKKVYKIFRKMTGIKKIKNGEDCAYTIAKFKRKMDKKFSKQITVDEMFQKFDEHAGKTGYEDMIKFKDRIKFYHKNKHEKPPCHNPSKEAQEKADNDLKNIPVKAMIGGVGVFCGGIIAVIPFPGCFKLGCYIAEAGVALIISAYADPYLDEMEKNRLENKSN